MKILIISRRLYTNTKKIVDYVIGAESMQDEAERLKLPELIALFSKPFTHTILI